MALPPLELPPIERVALLPGGPFALWKKRAKFGCHRSGIGQKKAAGLSTALRSGRDDSFGGSVSSSASTGFALREVFPVRQLCASVAERFFGGFW